MIHEAIAELGDRSGSSIPAIEKFIKSRHEEMEKVNPKVFHAAVLAAIKTGMKEGKLVKVRCSYKMNKDWIQSEKKKYQAKEAKKKAAEKKKKKEAEDKKKEKELQLKREKMLKEEALKAEKAEKERIRMEEERKLKEAQLAMSLMDQKRALAEVRVFVFVICMCTCILRLILGIFLTDHCIFATARRVESEKRSGSQRSERKRRSFKEASFSDG